MAEFAVRGGTIRLVCSPLLEPADIEAIAKGYDSRQRVDEAILRDLESILKRPEARTSVELLAALVASEHLDIKLAFRPHAAGIFHDKLGIFTDDQGNRVSFSGSINESLTAWDQSGNHESFHAFCSWTSDEPHVVDDVDEFNSLWNNKERGLEVISFPAVARDRLVAVAPDDGLEGALRRLRGKQIRALPSVSLREHQTEALEAWKAAGNRGICEHATASGKTLIGLTALNDWLTDGKSALVLLPSKLLLDQWYQVSKARLESSGVEILRAGAGHSSWRTPGSIREFTRPSLGPRATFATVQTAASVEFMREVEGGPHLLLVADEVHHLGAPSSSSLLSIDAGGRLGLSATPRRAGDEAGTKRILDYFGGVVSRFSLHDAIQGGVLCRYTYFVHPVELTEREAHDWTRLSQQVRVAIARASQDGDSSLQDQIRNLLVRRARIAKNARNKVHLAVRVLGESYKGGERWLVYCDTQVQLKAIMQASRLAILPVSEYHTAMEGDARSTLDYFGRLGGILLAIRCLDEGVDIPSVDHAFILASSRNPREFIQRRGRLLRIDEGKTFAVIHDAIVMPPSSMPAEDANALRGEFARALLFADDAANQDTAFHLRELARSAGIDLAAEAGQGFESEDGQND